MEKGKKGKKTMNIFEYLYNKCINFKSTNLFSIPDSFFSKSHFSNDKKTCDNIIKQFYCYYGNSDIYVTLFDFFFK
jgi:hypothetical protein